MTFFIIIDVGLGMTVLIGRDDAIQLPTLQYYEDENTVVKRHDANSPSVLQTIKDLHFVIDDHTQFIVDMWYYQIEFK